MRYEGMLAETISIEGYGGDRILSYLARPLGSGPYPGVVLLHYAPGWDEYYWEVTRKFAQHGYVALCPNLYHREGEGEPDDVAARVRAAGGIADDQVVDDTIGAIRYLRSLPLSNGKVGLKGSCSGGRYAFLVACQPGGPDAAVDCWGGRVVMSGDELNAKQPVAPLDYTKDLSCPLLGLFGAEDVNPSLGQVERHEEELKKYGKSYEFHVYQNAGHGFFYYGRPGYRLEQALDGWDKVFEFFTKHLWDGLHN